MCCSSEVKYVTTLLSSQLKDAFDTLRKMKEELLSVNHTDIIVLVNDMK